ncbi:hypothetical protein C0992_006735, partial [Termitomyces sp. T32_za158]
HLTTLSVQRRENADYAWRRDVLVDLALVAGGTLHVEDERDKRGDKADRDGGHDAGGDGGGLCEPEIEADVYKGGETATEEARDAVAEHEAPAACDAEGAEDISLALVDQAFVEVVNGGGGAVEDVAGVAVCTGDVDLACGGGERGDGDEEEDGGEGGTEVEDEARVGEEADDSACLAGLWLEVADELGLDTSEEGGLQREMEVTVKC